MDRVLIRDLLVRCVIGVRDEERRDRQDVIINVTMHADLHTAGRTDRVEDTVDYSAVKKRIVAAVESSRFFLVEALAERIADICLEAGGVEEVQVRVEKPGAARFARSVGVEIARAKE
jgi:FolB domain-containing protein